MDLEFLEYINNDNCKWHVNIGVPYGTHIWQVADSSQVNGLFKIKVAETKREYNDLKGLQSLQMSDIVPIVNTAFEASFRIAANARTAIKERGWGPSLNYCLLLDKRLSGRPNDNQQSTVTTETITVGSDTITDSGCDGDKCTIEFNNTEEFAALLTDKIVDDRNRQEGRKKATADRISMMQQREKHIELIKNLPNMTSGQLMAHGWLRMDKTVLENKRKRKEDLDARKIQQDEKKQKQDSKQDDMYQEALQKCTTTKEKLTMKDYTSLLCKCSRKGDPPFGKNRNQIMHQLNQRIDRLRSYLPLEVWQGIKDHALPPCAPVPVLALVQVQAPTMTLVNVDNDRSTCIVAAADICNTSKNNEFFEVLENTAKPENSSEENGVSVDTVDLGTEDVAKIIFQL
jgi:hypothetical protein